MTTIEYVINGFTGSIDLDATLKQSYEGASKPTDHPIEDGSVITDHVILEPETITIEGVISDHHWWWATAMEVPSAPLEDRAGMALTILRLIQKAKAVCKVKTERLVLEDVVMTKLSYSRDASTSRALVFTATFRSFVTATTEYVTVDQSAATTPGAVKKEGEKALKPVQGTPMRVGTETMAPGYFDHMDPNYVPIH
jgi:hypothetical protein